MNAPVSELPACGSPFEALDLLLTCQPQPTYTLRRDELALMIEQYRASEDDHEDDELKACSTCDEKDFEISALEDQLERANARLARLRQLYRERVRHLLTALREAGANSHFDLIEHLTRQRAFSRHVFGPGARTEGVLDHIARECLEVRACPSDIREWADLILLALDGAWRAGHEPVAIAEAIAAKQARNEARTWPDWRAVPAGRAIEHRARRLLYVCGPMSRVPEHNFPAFRAATAQLRARGFKVTCPTELNPDQTDWHARLRRDLAALTLCDAIVLLPGWEQSSGAMLELRAAHWLGLEVLHLQALLATEEVHP